MGAVCCCLRDECEDLAGPTSSLYRNCICLRCFLQNFLFVYTSLFQRGEEHAGPSGTAAASFGSSASLDNALSGVFRPPPRPLPYDVDPRYIRLQRDGLVSRREKASSHSQEEGEPLRRSDSDTDTDATGPLWAGPKRTGDDGTKGPQKPVLSLSRPKEASGFAHVYSSSEDEDVCPTCLEEYTMENPKIITECSHHFHLGCIYEWMERSDTCPVCGKVMAFDEGAI